MNDTLIVIVYISSLLIVILGFTKLLIKGIEKIVKDSQDRNTR